MKTRRTVVKTILSVMAVCALGVFSDSSMAQTTNSVSAGQTPKAIPARITQAIDETQLFSAKGSVHPLAQPQLDQGAVPDATPLKHIQMMLSRSDDQQRELSQLMADQMTKGSPNFHGWLTPQDFGARFGPADADIKVVTDWLASQGFSDITVSPGKILIDFSGNVGQVRNAFHTSIHQFLVNGELHQANVSAVELPAALSPVVRGIASLNDFRFKSMRRVTSNVTRMAKGQVTGGGNGFFAVGPADFKKIYNVPAGMDGAGGKIAIIGFTDINLADVDNYRSLFALSAKNLNIIVNGEDPGFTTEEGEADLDVETAGGVAQRAKIDYIISKGTLTSDPLFLGIEYVVFNNSDDIMSLSFGSCEPQTSTAALNFINAVFEEAAAQGISVTVSAGDSGSAGCDDFNTQSVATQGLAVSGLASTPFNVAVGGTDFDDVGAQITGGFWSPSNGTGFESANGYIPEVPWNDSCAAAATSSNLNTVCATPDNIVGGSGGASVVVPKPSYQTGIIPDGITAAATIGGVNVATKRFLPDISLFAGVASNSLSFYIECEADDILPDGSPADCIPDSTGFINFQPVGGTSASTPAFAGILAIVGQSEANAGRSRRLGNPNTVLYNLAHTAANVCNSSKTPLAGSPTCVFYDITKGNNSVPCNGGAAANCSAMTGGVLVSPASATTPAYTTAAGTGTLTSFDLATGLGSVNVTNLATKWPTATLAATTTTTTINGSTSAIHIGHATGVTLAARVTSAAGTPTGDVSFNAPQGTNFGGIRNVTLTNGTASGPAGTVIPGGGPYALKAHYGGDATFAQSDDPTGVQVTVDPENSGILPQIITFSGNTGTVGVTNFAFGSPYILRVDMLNAIGTAANCLTVTGGTQVGCAFDASGLVTLTDNGGTLDQSPYRINSEGSFEDNQIDLTVGAHAIVATYPGDNSYNASTATLNVTVTKAATTIGVTGTPTTGVNTTTPVTLTATISSSSNSSTGLTGTVQFLNNTNPIGSPVVVTAVPATANAGDGATATLNFTFPAGSASVTATYSGDGNYSGSQSTPPPLTFTVAASATNPAPTVSTILPTSATVGDPAFALTVNGTGFIASSTVSFGGTVKTPIAGSIGATQLMVAITTADIATAGIKAVTVTNGAPGGGTSTAVNFTVNATPTPTVSTISPGTVVVGSPAFTLTVNGTGFTASSVVNFNGSAKATTFVSATQLTAAITAADVATLGNKPVTVTNPGNVTSSPAVNLVVVNPSPTITSLSQNSVVVGSAAFTLTINGSGFVAGSTVNFGATAKTPATVNATAITVAITATDLATVAVVPITVTNPNTVPGNTTSNTVNFTVGNPVPTTTTISPTSATAGGAAFTLTVNGTSFVATSAVNFNGAAKTTTFVSATQLTAAVTAADIATAGNKPVTVTTAAPGGGTSSPAINFTVNASGGGTFSVAIPSTAQMLPSGSTLMVPISVTSSGGFAGSVTVNCTNLAPGVSCNNGQAFAINVTAANTTGNPAVGQLPVALAATSTNLTAMALPESNDLRHSPARIGLVTAGIGSGFAAIFFLLIPGRKRLRAALGLSLVCVLSLALGCGGGGGGGTVTPVATTTQITLTPPAKNSTGNFAFAAMVSGGSTPTGSVQFKDGGQTLGAAVSLSGGSAMFTENGLTPAGTHAISASYSGDSGHMTSSSGAINVTVTGNNTITINVPGATNGANQNLSITVQ